MVVVSVGGSITIVVIKSEDTIENVNSVTVNDGSEVSVVVDVNGGGRQSAPTGSP